MIWRAWVFIAGVPPGLLASFAWADAPSPAAARVFALAGGLLLVVIASLIARYRDDEPSRGAHLAAASSSGLVALPALAACLLGLAPDARWLIAVTTALLAVALYRGSRQRGPSGGAPRQLRAAALWPVAGASALALASGSIAALGAQDFVVTEARSNAIYQFDALVSTRPLPRCSTRPPRVEVLLDRGAHPRLSADGASVWFDASSDDGSRQVYRLERDTGSVVCWTCDEAGNNVRPAPGGYGRRLVFDTDRYATRRTPADTELQLLDTRSDSPRYPSRRLTFSPGPDDHALLGPGAGVVVWSRGYGGRFGVVTASIRSGHGGILLGTSGLAAAGGAQWTAPLAWSPDARSLVVVRGNPFRPLAAVGIDLATGGRVDLGDDVLPGGGASFSADGGWVSVVATRRAGIVGLLPNDLGFALGALATSEEPNRRRFRGTAVRVGEPTGEGTALDLGELADWGSPTGIALEADGTGLILGQRRSARGGLEERIVQLNLDCEGASTS